MKTFSFLVVVKVSVPAASLQEAEDKLADMNYSFSDQDTDEEFESEIRDANAIDQ